MGRGQTIAKSHGTQAEFGELVGITQSAVSEFIRRKVIPCEGKGRIPLGPALLAYCAHMRAVASGHVSEDGDLDLTAERARKAKEEADKLEMENALRRRQLLDRSDVDAAVAGAFARVRARLLNVPSKVAPMVAPDAPAEAEAAIRDAIYEGLRELSETTVSDLCGDDAGLVEDTGSAAAVDGERVGGPGAPA